MPPILIVGPSGVGKSTICKKAASPFGYTHHDMDEEIPSGKPDTFINSKILVVSKEKDMSVHLFDFGAGHQHQGQASFDFFRQYKELMITVMLEPRSISNRNGRSLDSLLEAEFRADRKLIYQMSAETLIPDEDIANNATQLRTLVGKVLGANF